MKLSEGIEWALHSVTVLALLPPGAALPTRKLAEFHGIPEHYLAKQLQALGRAGITEAVPGPKGGYRLAQPPSEVTVLDVVEAINGPEPAFRCTEIRQRGPAGVDDANAYALPCGIHRVMAGADAAWRASLRAVTLSDLVRHVQENVDPRILVRGAEWLRDTLTERS